MAFPAPKLTPRTGSSGSALAHGLSGPFPHLGDEGPVSGWQLLYATTLCRRWQLEFLLLIKSLFSFRCCFGGGSSPSRGHPTSSVSLGRKGSLFWRPGAGRVPEHSSQNIWLPPGAHPLGLSGPCSLSLSEKSVPEPLPPLTVPRELVGTQLPRPPPGTPKSGLSRRWAAGGCSDSSGFRRAPWLFERLAGELKLYLRSLPPRMASLLLSLS